MRAAVAHGIGSRPRATATVFQIVRDGEDFRPINPRPVRIWGWRLKSDIATRTVSNEIAELGWSEADPHW